MGLAKKETFVENFENSYELVKLRRILLQMDREKTRKKSIRGLKNMLVSVGSDLEPLVLMSLGMVYYYDKNYEYAIYYCKKTVELYDLQPEAIFCSTMLIHLYRFLGMRKQRFEAEGSRFHLMKKIIMQSKNEAHRLIALKELRQEFEDRDLLSHFYSFYDQAVENNPHLRLTESV